MVQRERVQLERDPKVVTIFSCLTLALFVAALDQTVVTTSLPSIVTELGGLTKLPWVVTAYMLSICVSTPLHGKLGDLYGRKRLFLIALMLFLVGSMLCGLSQSMLQLVVFRFLQGIGAGGIIVNSWAVIGDMVAPALQGRYQGPIQSAYALATISGPLVGGVLTEALNWRWVFYVNIPLCMITLVVIAVKLRLPAGERPKPVIDWWGVVLVSAGITALILLVTWGGSTYPWTSVPILGLGAATVVFFTAAVFVERRVREPLVPPHLFRNNVIRVAIMLAFVLGFATQGVATFMPLFQQTVDSVSPATSGLRMTPFWIFWAVASSLCGRVIGRTGRYRRFPIIGTTLLTAGMLALSFMDTHTPYPPQAAVLAVIGVSLGMMSSVNVLVSQNAAEPKDLGVAISTTTFSRTIGGALGVTLFGAVFTAVLVSALKHNLPADVLVGLAQDGINISRNHIDVLPHDVHEKLLEGFATALHGVFLAGALIAAIGIVIAPQLREIPLRRDNGNQQVTDFVALPSSNSPVENIKESGR